MTDKAKIEEKRQRLHEAASAFCREHLDEEYVALCGKLIDKMARKRTVPFMSGQMEIWAASVIYALGQINFLFDKSFEPYATADDICDYFGVKKNTVSAKAGVIRDMFKLGYYDEQFSTEAGRQSNPLKDMVMIDGLIVPKSLLPPEILKLIDG